MLAWPYTCKHTYYIYVHSVYISLFNCRIEFSISIQLFPYFPFFLLVSLCLLAQFHACALPNTIQILILLIEQVSTKKSFSQNHEQDQRCNMFRTTTVCPLSNYCLNFLCNQQCIYYSNSGSSLSIRRRATDTTICPQSFFPQLAIKGGKSQPCNIISVPKKRLLHISSTSHTHQKVKSNLNYFYCSPMI